jgi:RNA polymerase sigma factor (sigma-70 family)
MTAAGAACGVLASVTERPHDLAARLARDVDAAFPAVVEAYGDVVYGIALRTTRSPHDAEDLAAETFLRAYSALRRYPVERIRALELRGWLVTILLNAWRNSVRAASRRALSTPLDESPEPVTPERGPADVATGRDTEARLVALLADLPERQRLAVVLRHIGDLGYGEIAAVLGVPEGTAKSHVARGLRTLRARAAEIGLKEAL